VLSFAVSFFSMVGAFILPTLVGLLLMAGGARLVSPKYLAAFTLGIYFWFFSDTIGDSAYLDVNAGFGGGAEQAALILLFALGLLLVFSLDRSTFGLDSGTGLGLAIPLLLAFAVGVHGFGEGTAFSSTAANTPATSLLDAFGGLSAAAAFVLHKALEPMMIGAAYWVYCAGRARDRGRLVKDILLLTAVFVSPGIVGAATGYFLNYDATYFFAFGLGTSIYAAARLAKPLYGSSSPRWDSAKVAVSIFLGFLCLYFAALLHS
jgi:hypothetical protein